MVYGWTFRESEMILDFDINCRTALLCSTYVDNIVAVGSFDRRIKTFDLRASTKPLEQYSHHKMPILSVIIPQNHPNYLISGSEDGYASTVDRRMRKVIGKLKFSDGFPMSMSLVDGDNCLYVGDKAGHLHLIDCTNGKLKRVKVERNLHSGKIVGVEASHAGIVTCSTDKTVKLLYPDLGMQAFKTFDGADFGEVTSISHSDGIIAMGHSQEVIQVYSSKDITN